MNRMLACLPLLLACTGAWPQVFPAKPVKIVIAFVARGGITSD